MFGICLATFNIFTFKQSKSMSSVKFRIRSKANKEVSIKIYLSLGRMNFIEMNSGFSINPNDWSSKTDLPLQNSPENKDLLAILKKLEAFVHHNLNESQGKGELIDRFWLERTIDNCFNRTKSKESTLLLDHIQYIIDNAHTRKIKGKNRLGISKSRVASYVTFKGIITQYQIVIKKQLQLLDISKQFVDGFTKWLLDDKRFSMNYAGKQVDNLKTVCLDAGKSGMKINSFVSQIESFSESDDERYITTLSFEELEKIKNKEMPNGSLRNAKNWLLLGCEIGQRGSDLLKLSSKNMRYKNGNLYLDLIQSKTNKDVTIPIVSKHIIEILENHFPISISSQRLNDNIKIVCQLAEINEIIEGKKIDSTTRRKILGFYPKHDLISSHSFRRSFATNYYKKIPTPILMNLTGHSKESIFLKYINKREDKDSNADLFMKFHEEIHKSS